MTDDLHEAIARVLIPFTGDDLRQARVKFDARDAADAVLAEVERLMAAGSGAAMSGYPTRAEACALCRREVFRLHNLKGRAVGDDCFQDALTVLDADALAESPSGDTGGFYEDDENPEKVFAAFDRGEKITSADPLLDWFRNVGTSLSGEVYEAGIAAIAAHDAAITERAFLAGAKWMGKQASIPATCSYEGDGEQTAMVGHDMHPDAEAANAIAAIVTDRQGWTDLSTRYGIAHDVLRWMDEHRPRPAQPGREELAEGLRVAMLGTTDGDFIDPDSEVPAGEMFRLAAEWLNTTPMPGSKQVAPSDLWTDVARAVRGVTDAWDTPLDTYHDVPEIVDAVVAALLARGEGGNR